MRQSGNLTQIFSYSFSRGIQLWKQFVSEIICTILQTVEKLNAAKEAWMRIPLLWFTLQKAWKAAPDWTCRFVMVHTSKSMKSGSWLDVSFSPHVQNTARAFEWIITNTVFCTLSVSTSACNNNNNNNKIFITVSMYLAHRANWGHLLLLN